jgi:hypothetical protein
MTRQEAKKELQYIRFMDSRIHSIELDIERIEAVALKMTPSYGGTVQSGYMSKIEEALVKKEEYKSRLAKWMLKELDYKNRCLTKIEKIHPESLQQFLMFYYFDGLTMEKISEIIDKTPRWTYELFCTALDEYAKIP